MKLSKKKLVCAVLCAVLMLSLGISTANTRNFGNEHVGLSPESIPDEAPLPIPHGFVHWAMLDGGEFDLYLWESINRSAMIGMTEKQVNAFMLEHGFVIALIEPVPEGFTLPCSK